MPAACPTAPHRRVQEPDAAAQLEPGHRQGGLPEPHSDARAGELEPRFERVGLHRRTSFYPGAGYSQLLTGSVHPLPGNPGELPWASTS